MSVPRVIHIIWLGPKTPPWDWMESWNQRNPDVRKVIWREHDIRHFKLKNKKQYEYYMEKELYNGAADVARVEILERHGGIYVDADSICLVPISEWWFMKLQFFAGYEYDKRVGNGLIGSVAGHPILQKYIERIGAMTILEPPCYTVGGTLLTTCVDTHKKDKEIHILPQAAFYPKWKHRGETEETIYVRQMWGTTKGLYEEL